MIIKPEGLPPSYDLAVGGSAQPGNATTSTGHSGDAKKPQPTSTATMDASKSPPPSGMPQQFYPLPASSSPSAPHAAADSHDNTGDVMLYHYQNPHTHQTITTHLPPTHPAMQCLQQGTHIPGPTHWGILGLLSAVFCFPIGVLLCFVDRTVVCNRCGEVLHSGISA